MNRRTQTEIHQTAGPIASFVRKRRKVLGYTQEVLAHRTGVGVRFIKELELGKPSVRLDKVNQVLHFFGHTLLPCPLRVEKESGDTE